MPARPDHAASLAPPPPKRTCAHNCNSHVGFFWAMKNNISSLACSGHLGDSGKFSGFGLLFHLQLLSVMTN
jgi:hypothetical protein